MVRPFDEFQGRFPSPLQARVLVSAAGALRPDGDADHRDRPGARRPRCGRRPPLMAGTEVVLRAKPRDNDMLP